MRSRRGYVLIRLIAIAAAIAGALPMPGLAAVAGLAGDEVTHDAANPGFNYYGRWIPGRTAVTVNSGSLVEFAYTGNSCVLCFDVGGFAYFPGVFVQIDNGSVARVALSAEIHSVTLAPPYNTLPKGDPPYSVVSGRYHFVRFWVATHSLYHTPAAGKQWTTLVGACKFSGVRLSELEDLVPLPYISRQIEFLGDSITQGLRLLYTGTNDDIGCQLPPANWPQLVADLLAMKPVVSGFGGQALSAPGTSGAPAAIESFPNVYSGARWKPPVEPAAVVIYQGTNGTASPSEFQALYAAYLAEIRRAYPSAMIFAVCPHHRAKYSAAILNAAAGQHDERIVFLDYSNGVISKEETCDVVGHLNPGGAVRLATKLAGDIAARVAVEKAGPK